MTIQVKKIDEVLKNEVRLGRLIVGELSATVNSGAECRSVGACAIGALLLAAGMKPAEMLNSLQETRSSSRAGRLLKKEYGLSSGMVLSIELENDSLLFPSSLGRYNAVMGLVEFLAWHELNGVKVDQISAAYHDAVYFETEA